MLEQFLGKSGMAALNKIFSPAGMVVIAITITSVYVMYTLNSRFNDLRKETRDEINILAKLELATVVKDQESERKKQIEAWNKDVDAVVGKLARYDFLREYMNTETARELEAGSLEKVHLIVSQLFRNARTAERSAPAENGRARRDALQAQALGLIRLPIEKKIPGDHDDYHNMAAELARQDFPQLSLAILEEGMQRFPGSPDLIGSAMQYAVSSGELEKATTYFSRLQALDESRWNWRAFTFAVKFLTVKGDEEGARRLYEAARKRLPDDERPAVQYAGLFERRDQKDAAVRILEQTVRDAPTAPQAALKLAEFYKDRREYRKAMDMGRRALASDALHQSRISNGATHLTIGLAGEQLWVESLRTGAGNADVLLREFLGHYSAALKSPDTRPFIELAIDTRKPTIAAYLLAQGVSQERIQGIFAAAGLEKDGGGGSAGNSANREALLKALGRVLGGSEGERATVRPAPSQGE